jgi:G3E family GTPase
VIDLTILGGYLGAGKTTLLNHILQHNAELRLALLINDFGSINIDAALIESQDEQQINLSNGCVCCNLSDGFYAALETLKEMEPPPDHIIVEASGVADVHNLSQHGYTNELSLSGRIVLVDAETVRARANDKYVAETVRRQIKAADLLVLNKTDLVSRDEADDIETWLTSFNTCPVIRTTQGAVPLDALLGISSRGFEDDHHHHHPDYATWQHSTHRAYDRAELECALNQVKDLLRLKGVVRCRGGGSLVVQLVGKRWEVSARPGDVDTGHLVAIGLAEHIDTTQLDALFFTDSAP